MGLTIKELEALTPADKGKILTDGKSVWGLVCVGKPNTKNPDKPEPPPVSVAFKYTYRMEGKKHTAHLGTWPAAGLTDIRNKRDAFRAGLLQGTDPRAVEKAKREAKALEAKTARENILRQAEQAALQAEADHQARLLQERQRLEQVNAMLARATVRDLFERWEQVRTSGRADKGAEVRRSFEADVFGLIGDMAIEDVKRKHIDEIIDRIQSRATPDKPMIRTRKKTLADLRQLFEFAIQREYIESNPTRNISKKDIGKDTERERVLATPELVELFKRLPTAVSPTTRLALMVQLSTVCRIGEALCARWDAVDFERKTWTLPTTKNGKPHVIYLSAFALSQFNELHELTGETPYCFPNAAMNDHVCEKTVTKQVADRQRDEGPMQGRTKQTQALKIGERWTPHDLRRTGATAMVQHANVSPDVVERCMNHVETNRMRRIYQRATLEGPMRDAWERLGQWLALIQRQARGDAENVVMLRRAA